MKIAHIHPGLIEIPPKGWGAVEKIIHNYAIQMDKLGHTVDIVDLADIQPGQYDIVHVHMANQALHLYEQKIPYIFSIHDHHAEYYKGEAVYEQNKEAIKKSIFSLTHAMHYKTLFKGCHSLFFLSHGVDTSIYKPRESGDSYSKPFIGDYILMLATNGMAGDITIDRKGFLPGISIANKLNYNIALVGGYANQAFKEAYQSIFDAPNIFTDFSNPSEKQIIEYYKGASVFLHLSQIEAGMPNLTLLEALACNIPVVTYKRDFPKEFADCPNFFMIEPTIGSDTQKVYDIIANKAFVKEPANITHEYIKKHFDWSVITRRLTQMYECVLCEKNLDNYQTAKKYMDLIN